MAKKLAIAIALGAAVGMIGFCVLQPSVAQQDGLISFDLDCVRDHLGAQAGDLVAECEVTNRGKAVAKAFMPVGGSTSMTRRDLALAAASAAAATVFTPPLAAQADGATSRATRERARAMYGSRIFRLQGAASKQILDEESAFDMYITSGYASFGTGSGNDFAKVEELNGIRNKLIASAKKGDDTAAGALVKDFIKAGSIKELDQNKLNQYNPLERRSMGSPPNAAVLEETPKAGKGKVLGSVTSIQKK